MTIRIIYFILFYSVPFTFFAQEEIPKSAYHDNQFKVSLIDIARGTAGLYWENIFPNRTSLEFGGGLTFDDIYSLEVYEGPEYSKRGKPQDTRFMGSLAYKFRPFNNCPNIFFGAECKYRRYYSADADFFIDTGVWNGVDRKERNTKLIFGGTWYPNSRSFFVEYYAGYGWFHSRSKWHDLVWVDNNGNMEPQYVGGKVNKDQGMFAVGLKIGVEFRK